MIRTPAARNKDAMRFQPLRRSHLLQGILDHTFQSPVEARSRVKRAGTNRPDAGVTVRAKSDRTITKPTRQRQELRGQAAVIDRQGRVAYVGQRRK